MEETPVVQVKLVSSEAVKPASPTPSHLNDFTLSYVDQVMPLVPFFPTSGLLFYAATAHGQPVDIALLKTSLSETLTTFYPIAGRIRQSMIDCNDEGIPFIETYVNCPLSMVLNSRSKLGLMTKFLPPRDALGIRDEPVTELVHLAIQINVFTCGGVAIGWYDIHKVMDGMSSAAFFKHWAALASQRYEDIVLQPDFDSTVIAFPPLLNYEPPAMVIDGLEDILKASPPLVKRFIFRNTSISGLKSRAASEHVPNPSRFQAVAGFTWQQALQASKIAAMSTPSGQDDSPKDSVLQVTLDMRSRTNPPLPKASMGNLATIAVARAEKQASLPELVADIHAAVLELNDKIKEYEGEKAVEAVRANWHKLMHISSVYKEKAYKLVSWCRLGFNTLDFGFGKPTLVVPTDGRISPLQRNVIMLLDYADTDGEGIEAWLFLEEKEMAILESNQDFLAFACPVY